MTDNTERIEALEEAVRRLLERVDDLENADDSDGTECDRCGCTASQCTAMSYQCCGKCPHDRRR